jgi:uncharacterized protein YkvS
MSDHKIKVRPKQIRQSKWKNFGVFASVAALVFLGAAVALTVAVYSGKLGFASSTLEIATEGNRQIIRVPPGGDIRAAIEKARGGDVIELQAGATYYGEIVLPNKPITDYITIQSSRAKELTENQRVNPKQANLMAKILTRGKGASAVSVAPRAHHYRFVGIEFAPANADYIYNLVSFGEPKTPAEVAHHLEIDRCYLHPFKSGVTRRGVALNSANTVIKNSHLAGFAGKDEETQAIAGWTGTRDVKILNNYLEGGAENVLFGGAMAGKGLNPANLEFRRNHVTKPLEWRGKFTVKNLFELKDMRNAVIEENVFENNWAGGQDGTAILLTPASFESGPDARVEDITFRSNIVRKTANGITMTGTDYGDKNYPNIPVQNSRVRFENNLFAEISRKWSDTSGGRFLLLTSGAGPNDLTFDHNTIINDGTLISLDGGPTNNFVFTNNIGFHNEYGIIGGGKLGSGIGNAVLRAYMRRLMFRQNVVIGAESARYPTGNFYPSSLKNIQFVNLSGNDFSLGDSSTYRGKATDGKNIGCDFAALREMEKKVLAGF